MTLVGHARAAFMAALFFAGMQIAQATDSIGGALSIAKQNACLGCHAVNKKIVGPSFRDVAAKYKSNPSANIFLKNKIQKGGAGSWGVVPMPANAKLSDAELSLLVFWILQGAPDNN